MEYFSELVTFVNLCFSSTYTLKSSICAFLDFSFMFQATISTFLCNGKRDNS